MARMLRTHACLRAFRMQHACTQANSFLSLLNHNTAMFYARSLQHDLHAMHDLVDKAAASLHTYVGCNQVVRAPFWR